MSFFNELVFQFSDNIGQSHLFYSLKSYVQLCKYPIISQPNRLLVVQQYLQHTNIKIAQHCQFCKLKNVCRKRAENNLALAKMEFANPTTLDYEDIAEILPKLDLLVSWANDVKAYALKEATEGHAIPGYKLVEGRSVRKYSDEAAVSQAVMDAGYDPYEKKLLTITAMTKLLGKKTFNDLLGGLVIKPSGKPTLVPIDDSRQEMNLAKNEFKEE